MERPGVNAPSRLRDARAAADNAPAARCRFGGIIMAKHVLGRGVAIVALTAVLAACGTTTEQGTVGVERRQLLLVSSAEMDQGATAAYQGVLKEQGAKG